MTLTFFETIDDHRNSGIYQKDLQAYRADSKRSLKGFYFRKHPLAKQMKEWITFRTFIFTVGTLLGSHCVCV